MRLYLDMDGVLVDFVNGAAGLIGFNPALVDHYDFYAAVGETKDSFWAKIRAAGAPYWSGLKAYDWHQQVYQECQKYGTVTLLSVPDKPPESDYGKKQWIYSVFGENFDSFFLGVPKHQLAARDAVLIDDSDANVEAFVAAGGRAILFPQPWNKNRELCAARFEYLQKMLRFHAEQLRHEKTVLEAARDLLGFVRTKYAVPADELLTCPHMRALEAAVLDKRCLVPEVS